MSPGPSPGVTSGTLADFRGVSIWASAAARGAHWSRPALTAGLRRCRDSLAFPQVTCPLAVAGMAQLLRACAVPAPRGLHACFCRAPAGIPGMSPVGLAWAVRTPGSWGPSPPHRPAQSARQPCRQGSAPSKKGKLLGRRNATDARYLEELSCWRCR